MPKWSKAIRALISRATLRDILMLINMVFLLIVGAVLLSRTFLGHHGSFLAYAIGCGLMLAGFYRGYLIYQVLTQIQRSLNDGIEGEHQMGSCR